MNGGYIIISKNQADAYALSVKALELGKPILFYEDNTTCYYIDTISKSGTDIVLTKGDKTITIESDGTITEVGDIQPHLYYHGIEMYKLSDNNLAEIVIINNSSEPINTIAKLIEWANSIDGNVNIPVSGCVKVGSDSYPLHVIAKIATDQFNLIYSKSTGFDTVLNVDLSSYFEQVTDSNNKLL